MICQYDIVNHQLKHMDSNDKTTTTTKKTKKNKHNIIFYDFMYRLIHEDSFEHQGDLCLSFHVNYTVKAYKLCKLKFYNFTKSY